MKHFIYAGKSTDENRQPLSTEAQLAALKELATKEKLEIVVSFCESKPAKKQRRTKFAEMLKRIEKSEAEGILAWHPNRLARNPVDGGQIMWMLQQGIIKHIKTHERNYYPNDNALMMSVEFGMANQFIRDLSENTKRGLRIKAEKGWYPCPAPLGYLNNPLKKKGEKDIIKDPERFNLVRKMFDLILTGYYRPSQVLKIATEEWGLRNKKGKKLP